VKPLVSVITPTWGRHELLLNRCIPSVQAQAYPRVEHVIVSDGPDPELAGKMAELASGSAFYHRVQYLQLPEPHPGGNRYGSLARQAGILASAGDLIAYIDDDDALRPDHVRLLAALFDDSTIGWAYGVMASHSNSGLSTEIGHVDPPQAGQIGTPMIMHRRETLEHGSWGPASTIEDWEMVKRWLDAGIPYGRVHEATVDVWPSAYWG
jgi:glycosyltransferase involved in cell wall biosynthesis